MSVWAVKSPTTKPDMRIQVFLTFLNPISVLLHGSQDGGITKTEAHPGYKVPWILHSQNKLSWYKENNIKPMVNAHYNLFQIQRDLKSINRAWPYFKVWRLMHLTEKVIT